MPKPRCCVPQCSGIGGHLFPKNEKLKRLWVKAMRRYGWEPRKSSVVCKSHFELEDYYVGDFSLKRIKLKATAVPSVFNWSKPLTQAQLARRERGLKRRGLTLSSMGIVPKLVNDVPDVGDEVTIEPESPEKECVQTECVRLDSSTTQDDSIQDQRRRKDEVAMSQRSPTQTSSPAPNQEPFSNLCLLGYGTAQADGSLQGTPLLPHQAQGQAAIPFAAAEAMLNANERAMILQDPKKGSYFVVLLGKLQDVKKRGLEIEAAAKLKSEMDHKLKVDAFVVKLREQLLKVHPTMLSSLETALVGQVDQARENSQRLLHEEQQQALNKEPHNDHNYGKCLIPQHWKGVAAAVAVPPGIQTGTNVSLPQPGMTLCIPQDIGNTLHQAVPQGMPQNLQSGVSQVNLSTAMSQGMQAVPMGHPLPPPPPPQHTYPHQPYPQMAVAGTSGYYPEYILGDPALQSHSPSGQGPPNIPAELMPEMSFPRPEVYDHQLQALPQYLSTNVPQHQSLITSLSQPHPNVALPPPPHPSHPATGPAAPYTQGSVLYIDGEREGNQIMQ